MTTILTKKKDTAGAPAPGDLTNAAGGAELAVNTATKRLYTKDSGGTVVEIGTNPSTIDTTTVDTTNLEVTNIKAKDGTAAMQIADSTGVVSVTAAPVLTALTASQAVFTDASKALVSNAITGTGSVVMSTSPTLVTPALGTPSALVGTNITGTAANFNINGTVGATTATTGAFTSVTASADSSFDSTGAVKLSSGTTAERPTGAAGKLRFNTTTAEFEGYNGATWASVGGASLSNDTSTATNIYPLSAAATTGTASTLYTSNAKFLYKPSTGELQASALVASNGIVVNSQTVAASYTIAVGFSAMSSGPVTIASGQAVTVSSGSRWVVV